MYKNMEEKERINFFIISFKIKRDHLHMNIITLISIFHTLGLILWSFFYEKVKIMAPTTLQCSSTNGATECS